MNIKYMLLCIAFLAYGTTIWSSNFQPPHDDDFVTILFSLQPQIPRNLSKPDNFQSTAPLGLLSTYDSQSTNATPQTNEALLTAYESLQLKHDELQQELAALKRKYEDFKIANDRGMNLTDGYEELLSENNRLKQKLSTTQKNTDFKMYASFLAGQASAITPKAIQAALAGCAVAKVALHLLNK